MRVLVTRPSEDAQALVAALEARGHEALVEPMMTVTPAEGVAPPLDLDGVQALLFTSANGVRAFAALSDDRILPVFAVGEASAAAARAAGFTVVESADGDVVDLARLVDERLNPDAGALFHGASSTLAGDLKGELEAAGFAVRRVALYDAQPAAALSDRLRNELAEVRLDAVTLFSPRTAETFAAVLGEAGLVATCEGLAAVCLSDAVAEKVSALPWRDVRVAERPNQDALLACIDDLAAAVEDTVPAEPVSPAPEPADMQMPDAPAQRLIARFGGIRPMASKLGIAVSTVQGWRERGSIPVARHEQILAAAAAHSIAIDRADVTAGGRGAEAHPKAPEAPAMAGAPAGPMPEPAEAAVPPEPGPAEDIRGARNLGAWIGGAALGVTALAVGAGGAMLARDIWMPVAPPQVDEATVARLAELERRLAELEAVPSADRSADLAAAQDSLTGLADDLAAATERLEALEARLAWAETDTSLPDNVRARLEAVADLEEQGRRLGEQMAGLAARVEDLADLEERVDRLSELRDRTERLGQRISDLDARIEEIAALKGRVEALAATRVEARSAVAGDAELALGVLQLRDALRGSGPFEAELEMLQGMAAAAPEAGDGALGELIAPLAPHAVTGVSSLAVLKAEFPAVAREIVAQAQAGEDGGWVAGVLRRVSGLVTVRPSRPIEGGSPGAVVARAEAHLAADDLASAVRELDALGGAAAEAAGPWRSKAEARLTADRVLTALGQVLTARRGSAGG